MDLYFQKRNKEEMFLGTSDTVEGILKIMNKFLDKHNFESHYIRTWRTLDNVVHIDFGSWSEFMLVKGDDKNEFD